MAQVIVLARYEDEVMEPLTRPDAARTWHGCFVQIPWFVGGWHIEFERWNRRRGVLKDLEALPWNEPKTRRVPRPHRRPRATPPTRGLTSLMKVRRYGRWPTRRDDGRRVD